MLQHDMLPDTSASWKKYGTMRYNVPMAPSGARIFRNNNPELYEDLERRRKQDALLLENQRIWDLKTEKLLVETE